MNNAMQEKEEFKTVDGNIINENVKSFVELKDINKIYPNGIQAVYDFNIKIQPKDFIVLVGPSGCGKSTTLRMIAGLEDISSGSLYIGKVLSNYVPSKNRDISMVFQSYALYPQMTVYENIAFPLKVRSYDKIRQAEKQLDKRDVEKLYEDPQAVYDAYMESIDNKVKASKAYIYCATKLHVRDSAMKLVLKPAPKSADDIVSRKDAILSLLDTKIENEKANIEKKGWTIDPETLQCLDENRNPVHYKRRLASVEIRQKVFEAAKILDLGPYLDRKPKELSGGQMQRVALGRAIVRNAKLFLMDEPLSNLDAKLRVQMRSEIVRIHEQIGATTIYVTHDQTEAMTMATRIAVMSKGWVQQIDEPSVIYNHPNNIFVATFIGSPAMNILEGTYDNGYLVFDNDYRIKLSDDYKRVHDDFYKRKIAQTKQLLNKPAVRKMEGIIYLDKLKTDILSDRKEKVVFALSKEEQDCLDHIKRIGEEISDTDEDGKIILSAIESMNVTDLKSVKMAIETIHHALYNLKGITSKELSILHNVQAFSKTKKDNGGKEEVLFYNKRHGKAKKAVSGYKNVIHMKDSSIVLTNNLFITLNDLLSRYEYALEKPHSVRVGIRPEHIHLDNEYHDALKSDPFACKSEVVELLGSELLLHTTFEGKEMIAKISTGTLVKPHEEVKLSFDTSKVLVFDVNSGDTIADWVKAD